MKQMLFCFLLAVLWISCNSDVGKTATTDSTKYADSMEEIARAGVERYDDSLRQSDSIRKSDSIKKDLLARKADSIILFKSPQLISFKSIRIEPTEEEARSRAFSAATPITLLKRQSSGNVLTVVYEGVQGHGIYDGNIVVDGSLVHLYYWMSSEPMLALQKCRFTYKIRVPDPDNVELDLQYISYPAKNGYWKGSPR
jgi:hypothetical protein